MTWLISWLPCCHLGAAGIYQILQGLTESLGLSRIAFQHTGERLCKDATGHCRLSQKNLRAFASPNARKSRILGFTSQIMDTTPIRWPCESYVPRGRGSRTSLKPSPRRLKPRTAREIAIPGNTSRFILLKMYWRPSPSMAPHSAVGDCTPDPGIPAPPLLEWMSLV